jgi:hypothetical protein
MLTASLCTRLPVVTHDGLALTVYSTKVIQAFR